MKHRTVGFTSSNYVFLDVSFLNVGKYSIRVKIHIPNSNWQCMLTFARYFCLERHIHLPFLTFNDFL